jgi:hypothetical protein
MNYPEKRLKDVVIIFDEIDRCYQDHIITLNKHDSHENVYGIKYPPKVLRNCK